MGKSVTGKVIDQVAAGSVAAWFHEFGFRRRGRSFVRPNGELVLTSNLQASKLNTPEDARLCLNLGVEWPYWRRIWTEGRDTTNPALAPCFIQQRLHPCDGPGRDYWWRISEVSDPEQLAGELITALRAHAHRFWAQYGDLDRVLALFDEGQPVPTGTPWRLVRVALMVRAGRWEQARNAMTEATKHSPKGLTGCSRIAEQLGLSAHAV